MSRLNRVYGRFRETLNGTILSASAQDNAAPFPQDLILHVTYHKCLTLYYKRVMQVLAAEFPFVWTDYYGQSAGFNQDAVQGSGKRIICLSDRDDVMWDQLPPYRASHFIRDPRDLIVSGYHYHLWTKETWCQASDFPWRHYVIRPFFELVEPDPANHPVDISYQAYLKSLDRERGMILEMIFRRDAFEQMGRWNYRNPSVLELRYEQVIGNEAKAFRQLFEHYRFQRRLLERGVQVAEELRLANLPKGEGKHLRNGETKQWKTELPPQVQQVFKQAHGTLLIQLGYERDLNW